MAVAAEQTDVRFVCLFSPFLSCLMKYLLSASAQDHHESSFLELRCGVKDPLISRCCVTRIAEKSEVIRGFMLPSKCEDRVEIE